MTAFDNTANRNLVPNSHGRCGCDATAKHPKILIFSSSFHTWGRKTQKLAHMGFILMLLIHSQNQSGVQTLGCTQITPIQW